MKTTHKYSSAQWDSIVKEAVASNSYRTVADKYGITTAGLAYQLKKRGIKLDAPKHRIHSIKDDFFAYLNERSAYWLGFIMADGTISKSSKLYKRPNRLTINLSFEDVDHIEKLLYDLGSTAEIKTYIPKGAYSNRPMSRVHVNSVKLCSDLEKYGVIERKTGLEHMPTNIPDHLIRHFIRGYFDGDGTVYCSNGDKRLCYFSIIGNFRILSYIQVHLVDACNLGFTKLTKDRKCEMHYLTYGGRIQLKAIYEYLYDGATVFLERKKEKFSSILSE